MSLNDKSKKELFEMAKGLNLKATSKMDKKALIKLIQENNKSDNAQTEFKQEESKKEIIQTILEPKEERVSKQDLKDMEDARTEMTDQPANEQIETMEIGKEMAQEAGIDHFSEEISTIFEDKNHKNDKNDDFSYSEGYREKISYNNL